MSIIQAQLTSLGKSVCKLINVSNIVFTQADTFYIFFVVMTFNFETTSIFLSHC